MVIFLLIHHFLLVYLIDPAPPLHPHPACHQYHPRNPYFPTIQSEMSTIVIVLFLPFILLFQQICVRMNSKLIFTLPGRVQRTVATVVGNLQLAKVLDVFLRRTQ